MNHESPNSELVTDIFFGNQTSALPLLQALSALRPFFEVIQAKPAVFLPGYPVSQKKKFLNMRLLISLVFFFIILE